MDDLPSSVQQFLAWFGGLGITTAALVGAAYWLFQRFGDNWLKAKFDERLEAFRHQQQQEIEKLRFRFSGLLDRRVKLNQYEFEVLPEIWGLLSDAYTSVYWFVHPLQLYPDLDKMRPEELEDVLDKSELPEWDKKEIRLADRKTDIYIKKQFWIIYGKSRSDLRKFLDFFRKNKIFINSQIAQKIDEFGNLLFDALQEREFQEKNPARGSEHNANMKKVRDEGDSYLKVIGDAIQKRLWDMRYDEVQVDA